MTDKEKTTAVTVVKENDKPIVSQESELVNDYNIDGFLEKRKEFITKVNKIMVEGKDYHVIQGKKSLAKGGAEKIGSIFGWTAVFEKDLSVSEAFREVPGLIAFVCKLSKSGVVIGEGRGAALLSKNAGDPNKCIKMAQKSAFIDAVLRASGLSDFFTQDLEDMPREQISQPVKSVQQTPNADYFCSVHDIPLVIQPAGVSKQGKPYPSFWKCPEKVNDRFCKGPFIDIENNRVKQNPETGNMDIVELSEENQEVMEAQVVEETSVDKARRILNAKVPKGAV